ncbi:UDP-4-amino-4-deoxy-L-arabinose--oxoglutarate aminotransferase [uncultured archaeon]|nr:UDP-4-amino-4-deoxy-L-arabinose--oxoglutarate aminotransferase [uncultured archaeon]
MEKISWYRTSFGEEEVNELRESVKKECISQGPVTNKLEEKLAEKLNVPYAMVTTSGSVALVMSMMAIGLKPYDEVIVPNRTWIATANAPLITGAKVSLVDVVEDLPLIDASQIEKKINSRTRAILPVHLNGRSNDMEAINKIAKNYDLWVVEDACQALFSKNSNGYLGTQSDIGCFSLGVTKLISTGQGGIIVTKNKELYERLKLIRNNGTENVFVPEYQIPGCNFKFTDLLASIGLVQLTKAEDRINHVTKIYSMYKDAVDSLDYLKMVHVNLSKGEIPLYVEVLCKKKQDLSEFLKSNGIETRPFLPDLNTTKYIEDKGVYPNSKTFSEQGLFLPCGPTQPIENIERVIDSLKKYQ